MRMLVSGLVTCSVIYALRGYNGAIIATQCNVMSGHSPKPIGLAPRLGTSPQASYDWSFSYWSDCHRYSDRPSSVTRARLSSGSQMQVPGPAKNLPLERFVQSTNTFLFSARPRSNLHATFSSQQGHDLETSGRGPCPGSVYSKIVGVVKITYSLFE